MEKISKTLGEPQAPARWGTPGRAPRVEDYTCSACGAEFERYLLFWEGEAIGSTECQKCSSESLAEVVYQAAAHDRRPVDEDDLLNRMQEIGVNVRRHGHLTLQDLEATQPAVVRVAREFVERCLDPAPWQEHRGLYLLGETGRGKTQILVGVARELLLAGMPDRLIVFDRARALVSGVRDRYGTGTVEQYLDRRRNARVWLLDDAGRESPGADAFRAIDDVFDAREGHTTMLTSNKSPDEMAEQWAGEDFAGSFQARLAGFEFKRMEGRDWRD